MQYFKEKRVTLGTVERERQRSRLWKLQFHKCAVCGKYMALNESDRHHVVKRSQGGDDKDENIKLLHRWCHNQVHDGRAAIAQR